MYLKDSALMLTMCTLHMFVLLLLLLYYYWSNLVLNLQRHVSHSGESSPTNNRWQCAVFTVSLRQTEPGIVAFYDIRQGNGAGLFLQLWSPHWAAILWSLNTYIALSNNNSNSNNQISIAPYASYRGAGQNIHVKRTCHTCQNNEGRFPFCPRKRTV